MPAVTAMHQPLPREGSRHAPHQSRPHPRNQRLPRHLGEQFLHPSRWRAWVIPPEPGTADESSQQPHPVSVSVSRAAASSKSSCEQRQRQDEIDHDVPRELPVRPLCLLPGRRDRVIDRIPGHERRQHPSDTQPVSRPSAPTAPLSAIGPRSCRPPARTPRTDTPRNQDQLRLSGIASRAPTSGAATRSSKLDS
jgi:hypothetical protein